MGVDREGMRTTAIAVGLGVTLVVAGAVGVLAGFGTAAEPLPEPLGLRGRRPALDLAAPPAPPVTLPPVTFPPQQQPPPVAPTLPPPPPAPPQPTLVSAAGELGPGAEGEEVRTLQVRLGELRYDPGEVDGRYGRATALAVMAFQKVHDLPRTGRTTPELLAGLGMVTEPAPQVPDGGATRIEVDLKRQVLSYYQSGGLVRILAVSSGNGKRYCAEGSCGVAVTPSGSFRIERRIRGLRVSRLGRLYDPLYFRGGYAIHGSPSIPARPASHGCVRIPMHVSRWFLETVPNGTPVYILGGKNPVVPLPEFVPPPAATPPEPPGPAPAPGPGPEPVAPT